MRMRDHPLVLGIKAPRQKTGHLQLQGLMLRFQDIRSRARQRAAAGDTLEDRHPGLKVDLAAGIWRESKVGLKPTLRQFWREISFSEKLACTAN